MRKLLKNIDGLLRGSFTQPADLASGRIAVPVATLLIAAVLLGAGYGVFMGLYAVLRPENASWLQLLATTAKVPLLFLLTLAVTFPSLYVFSALANSRLHAAETLQLLLVAVTVNLAILASFGPVTGFFMLSTESYPFIKLLNVAFFAIAGFCGIAFLRRTLNGVFAIDADAADDKAARRAQRRPRNVLRVWTLIYAAVGAQMGWILRPFIGSPDRAFELFRERESNVFVAILVSFVGLFR